MRVLTVLERMTIDWITVYLAEGAVLVEIGVFDQY